MRTIEAFAKGLRILEYTLEHGEFRIGELATAVGIPSSNTTLFLNTMMAAGLIRRGEVAGLYRVTDKLLGMFDHTGPTLHDPLRSAAKASMQQLHELLNENVLLAVMDGDYTTHYIAKLVADRVVQVQPGADEHFPMHRTAHGKAILAFLDDEEIERHIATRVIGGDPGASSRQVGALRQDLETCRRQGYAVNRGDYEADIMAIAAPVFLRQRVVASIVVQLPKFRHDESELDRYGAGVAETARTVSAEFADRLSSPSVADNL
jgi:DNA-binding IclR family transcriptional regulator